MNKSLKPGWIPLKDFAKKYYDVTGKKAHERYCALMVTIRRLPSRSVDKIGNTTVVIEKDLCILKGFEYKEEV